MKHIIPFRIEWNYTYDLIGNLVSQAGGGGNLVAGDGFYREYNSLNQLVLIRNGSSGSSPLLEQYYYDPFNERIKVWRNDTAGTTIYAPFREFMQVRNSSGIYNYTYVYDGSTLVARVNPDQSVHYYHPDHLGSTTLITDQNGNVVEETFYEPFGAVTSGGTADVKLYTGQFSDEATGQYYYGARYYKPGIGFVQPDPILQNAYDPQLLNSYSYSRNNPYKFVDPNGKEITFSQLDFNVGTDPSVLVFNSVGYVGRIVKEYKTPDTTKESGYSYDYDVLLGTFNPRMQTVTTDMFDWFATPTKKLSEIYDEDQKDPLKTENVRLIAAMGLDVASLTSLGAVSKVLGLSDDSTKALKLFNYGSNSYSVYQGLSGDKKAFLGIVPGGNTYLEITRVTYEKGDQVKIYTESATGKGEMVWYTNPKTGNPTWRLIGKSSKND